MTSHDISGSGRSRTREWMAFALAGLTGMTGAGLLAAGIAMAQTTPAAPAAAQSEALPAAALAEIHIDNFFFEPKEMTVKARTLVTWTNRDDIPHTIVETSGEFHSGALDTDDKFSFTFLKPGTYEYFCGLHPHMTGKVTVTP